MISYRRYFSITSMFFVVFFLFVLPLLMKERMNPYDTNIYFNDTQVSSEQVWQPLTILESYAAHKPVIATDVGNCRELIYGVSDDYGDAGILTHIMNIDEIAQAMIHMAKNTEERLQMGENGYQRVMHGFRIEDMRETYKELYQYFSEKCGQEWTETSFRLTEKVEG